MNTNTSDVANVFQGLEAKTKTFSNLGVDVELAVAAGGTIAVGAGGAITMATSKITGLGNGTAAQDAAAFGQIFTGFQAPVIAVATTSYTTTSNAFQTTNLSATITPTSATHRIKITVMGVLRASVVSTEATLTIARGTTNLAVGGVLGFGRITGLVAAETRTPCSMQYIDSPATASAVTYNVRLKNSDNVNTVGFGEATDQVIILEEIV